MTIQIKPELQQFVEEQVKAGRFATPEDVVEAGLGRLRDDDFGDFRAGELDSLIGSAEAQFARREDHSMSEVRSRFRDKAAGGLPPGSAD